MTIEEVIMYRGVCSFPECDEVAGGDEYWAWAEREQCIEMMVDSDWKPGSRALEDGRFYCLEHPTSWGSDYESDIGGVWDLGSMLTEWPQLILDDVSKAADGTAYIVYNDQELLEMLDRMATNEIH